MVGWAKVGPYDGRHHYDAGIGEALLDALAEAAAERGLHKLFGRILTTNAPSIEMVRACVARGGVQRRHGRLDGEWRDVLIVERLLDRRIADPSFSTLCFRL